MAQTFGGLTAFVNSVISTRAHYIWGEDGFQALQLA